MVDIPDYFADFDFGVFGAGMGIVTFGANTSRMPTNA
jgi:hypothetical protein